MLLSKPSEVEIPRKSSTMFPERSKPLHNFSFPTLGWSNQRLLPCMKEPPSRSSDNNQRLIHPIKIGDEEEDDGVEGVRKKLLIHLPVGRPKYPIEHKEEEEERLRGGVVPAVVEKPWNLRTRRSACKAPNEIGGKSSKLDDHQQHQRNQNLNSSSLSPKSMRVRGVDLVEKEKEKKKEKRKFSSLLSKDEIKLDFLLMTGNQPPRRPKKRPRIVQKQLDTLLPGLWLPPEVTAERYKVPDQPETR